MTTEGQSGGLHIGGNVNARDVIGTQINVGPSSGVIVEKMLSALDKSGTLCAAELAGLQRLTIIRLAQRLTPSVIQNFDQAIGELENVVAGALGVIEYGRADGEDSFVNATLAEVANKLQAGDIEGGANIIDLKLAELDQREAKQQAAVLRSRVALLKAGIRQDVLLGKRANLVARIEKVVEITAGGEAARTIAAFRGWFDDFYRTGEEKGAKFMFEVAIDIAHRMKLAAVQHALPSEANRLLALALTTLSGHENRIDRLDEAITACREELEEYPRKNFPFEWASAQTRLGCALFARGRSESTIDHLQDAVRAHRAALEVFSRARTPYEWALALHNLGLVQQKLAEREAGSTRLDEAVRLFRLALEVRTRSRVANDWAETQGYLGVALMRLGERENSIARLNEAVAVYSQTLEVLSREQTPFKWAATQNNRAAALLDIGVREVGTGRLREAALAIRAAGDEYLRMGLTHDWAIAQFNLGITLSQIGQRERLAAPLFESIVAYRAALKVRTRKDLPLEWAKTLANLGDSFVALGELSSDTTNWQEAVSAYEEALEVLSSAWPPDWVKSLKTSLELARAGAMQRKF